MLSPITDATANSLECERESARFASPISFDRFKARPASYFQLCQMQQAGHRVGDKHIYCYSFALKPEEHQPSGTCNFSRIDNAQLTIVTDGNVQTALEVYAVYYNVLRIMSGMGGLAYSN